MTEQIGIYQDIEAIGSGGMATVYRAYHPKLARYVAIKLMHVNYAQDSVYRARFEREARIVANLDHPNIVPVYDFDEHNNQPYLVMKQIEGTTLKDLLIKQPLSSGQILEILTPIAGALHHAHTQGVLHRDVKPSNVLIDAQGTVYLTDFGLARIVRKGESTMSADVMLGTPYYISPEQARGGKELDARVDVYSLGVMLYQMATGQVPFTSDSSYGLIYHHIHTPPPNPGEINPAITKKVEAVILKALAKEPEERFATPIELMEAYQAALAGHYVPLPERVDVMPPLTASWDGKTPVPPVPPLPPEARSEADLLEEKGIRMRVEWRLTHRRVFYGHASVYVLVNGMLWSIWALTDAGHMWPMYPMMGWGIGLVAHAMGYYYEHGLGREHRERALQREIKRERGRVYGVEKPKNKNTLGDFSRVRLTEDGELSDSFIYQIEWRDQPSEERNQREL